jgi:hypothetical protein
MIDRRHIEELLRLNGVKETAPDEEIKSVLISARWHEKDIETALVVLRENKDSHATRVERLNKVFTSDDKLKPELISSLLGVDVDISNDAFGSDPRKNRRSLTFGQIVQICCLSILISSACIIGMMWHLEVGLFHFTMR